MPPPPAELFASRVFLGPALRAQPDRRDEDSDDDGVIDGEDNAGTIASFDSETGKLVIDLFGGETVSGTVDEGTEIECKDNSGAAASSDGSEAGVPGAVVQEAELNIAGGQATFEEVELSGKDV